MSNPQMYLQNRVRMGLALLITGIILSAAGLILQFLFTLPFNARIISGVGIFLFGAGVAQMLRYGGIKNSPRAAARLVNEERDERSRLIRAQAGSRAFWVSLVMTYIALMWLSFASSGSLPDPSPDSLWYYLAAAVVVPFIVYIAGIVYEQNNR